MEGTEYAALNFANTSGGYILAGSAVAIVEIVDDEGATLPVVKLLALDNVASESGLDTATLKLERNGATTNNLTVNLTFSGTASFNTDYTAPNSVVIPAGSASATLTLTPIDDAQQEGTKTAIISITANAAYARDTLANSQTVLIQDDDLPTVTVVATDASASESPGDSAIFTITRAAGDPRQELIVDYALAGRAVHGADYRRLDGRALIPSGVMSTRVEIQPIDDSVDEGTQDVILLLRSSTNYAIDGTGTATVNITDNDASQVYVRLSTSAGTEPASGSATAIAFQIIRPASGTAITVNYSISGTATTGLDYIALPGTIAFAAADTSKTINVSALADEDLEDAEAVTLTLLPGVGYTLMASQDPSATGFILDGDQPTVDVSAANTSSALTTAGTESSTSLRFIISRKVATTNDLVVNYTMSGTATEGQDYTGTSGSVTILSNATSAFVTITPVNDVLPEGVESIVMTLTPSPGNFGLRTPTATLLLGDNDAFPSRTVAFASTASSVMENVGVHNVAVNISGIPPGEVTVNYRVSGGTATGSGYDFTLADGLLTFPSNTTSLSIPITIHLDTLPEPAETIVLQLFNAIGANLGTSTHTNTISNLSLPEAFTDGATNLLAAGATLRGRALPNGLPTDVWFQYGSTTAYGSNTAPQSVGSGTNSVNVTAAISGFVPAAYHYRCVATNSMGITYGIDQLVPSRNAALTNLVLITGILSPSFTSGNTNYAATVSNALSTIALQPVAADAAAFIKVNGISVPSGSNSGPFSLTIGTNVLMTSVISPDGIITNIYTVTVTRQTPYQTWAAAYNLTGPNSGPYEDFDGDGNSNLMEFAINTDPTVASVGLVLEAVSVEYPEDHKYYFTVSHRRRIDPGTLVYQFQSSTDLSVWTDVPAGQLEQIAAVPLGDGVIELVTFKTTPSIEDFPAPRFLRLKLIE